MTTLLCQGPPLILIFLGITGISLCKFRPSQLRNRPIAFYLIHGMRKKVKVVHSWKSTFECVVFLWFTVLCCVHKAKQSYYEVTIWCNFNILVWNCLKKQSKQWQFLKNKQFDLCLTLTLTFLECISHSDIRKLPYENDIPKISKLPELSAPQFVFL